MFEKLRIGWQLAGESFAVLKADKKLLVFPLLSGLACLLILLSFGGILFGMDIIPAALKNPDQSTRFLLFALGFAFYFVNYFVVIFFNSALMACALVRFNGGEPTLGDGLRAATSRLPQILGWALVSATVGMLLKVIESWSDKVGQFVTSLVGMAWGAVTFFVVPVLVVEKLGPIQAVKRSTSIVRQTWGESMAGNFSIGLIVFLWSLAATVPAILGVVLGTPATVVIGVGVTVALWIVIGLVSAAAHVIITGILYQFASQKPIPAQFSPELLERAFACKS
jgi:Family of unknown function (DUF6159)